MCVCFFRISNHAVLLGRPVASQSSATTGGAHKPLGPISLIVSKKGSYLLVLVILHLDFDLGLILLPETED